MKGLLTLIIVIGSCSVHFAQSPSFNFDTNSKYIYFPKNYADGNFYGASQLRLGSYLTLGNFGYSNSSWIGSNALLDYTSYNGQGNGSRNEFIPMYAQGEALVMQLSFTDGSLKGWVHDWNGQSGAVDFNNFQNVWNLGSDKSFIQSNLGIGTSNPSAKLEVVGASNTAAIVLSNENFMGFKRSDGALVYGVGHTNGEFTVGRTANLGSTAGTPINIATGGAYIRFSRGTTESMRITGNGRVGIGTATPDATLAVNGDIHAEEVRVDLNVPGPDYVFEEGYDLMSLDGIQQYITENKHLPEVPSASEMEEKGIEVSNMSMLLLKKIEELTLHMIQIKEENKQYRVAIESLKNELTVLKNQ